ncbi:N-terminal glutamine amidase-domain-containing protein [Mucor mucedo]|uniref:N-terminal glutamine amidase-domain-containing protein n=1 Tax=Mucor mucedo TaxID=29922 RepID=UPI00221F82C9|nr:N-terminal glutamine amidase-domain-containing protein [Mucor mucedo]KAI7891808.1 N-terminal glutamine amidase-domain-containing protein [Mucor mucedo]
MLKVERFDLKYTNCYCEENIYLLCKEIEEKQPDMLHSTNVIYISNDIKMVPLWKQKAGVDEQPVVWDYHVILFVQKDKEALVYDYDSVLSFPCTAEEYITETFKPAYKLKSEFDRYFRVVPAETYLSLFSSDRSHMIKSDGSYHAPPPDYPAIQSCDEVMNLDQFISMKKNNKYGIVCKQFYKI